jgi:hypothetical protein
MRKSSTGTPSVLRRGENSMATKTRMAAAVDHRHARALAAGKERRKRGEFAVSATYQPRGARLRVELASGVVILVPAEKVQELANASARLIRSVELRGGGYSLHWPALDLDVSVPQLLAGCFGDSTWMSALAGHAGRRTSAAKAAAARANGKKGGRPRKVAGRGRAMGAASAQPRH